MSGARRQTPLTFISLFSGIGGLDLGLERAGMRCVSQVEIDQYCRQVLAKQWPKVLRHDDVRHVGAHNLPVADVIAGGFPCQDVSNAGRRAGIEGARSGLWSEFARLIGELRPRYVLVENTTGLLLRGMGRVLGDLSTLGYDAEWTVIPACAVGAPHPRERLFILAYPDSISRSERNTFTWHAIQAGSEWQAAKDKPEWKDMECWIRQTFQAGDWDDPSTALCGVSDGLSGRMERLRGLGNAVVPQVAEYVGRLIVEHASEISA